MNIVYILECADGTFYTGWTNNLERRLISHNKGLGSKYTRSRLPVKCVYQVLCESKIEAQKLEYQIKKMTRQQKQNLIDGIKKTLQ